MSMKHVILTSTAVLAIGLSGIPLAQTASEVVKKSIYGPT